MRLFKVYHSSCEVQKCEIVKNLYFLVIEVYTFLTIGFKFLYDVAVYAGLGKIFTALIVFLNP